jgi:zinc D-Ala-D-Ala carboxypeptidase
MSTGPRGIMNSTGDRPTTTRSRDAIRAMAVAVALCAALVPLPWTAPRAAAIGPLPACRIADVLTVPDDYESWRTTLVDWLLRVPADYVPPDLVPTSEAGIDGGGYVRAVALDDLRAMAQAARKAGAPISVIEAYRSYQDQVASFNGWVAKDSYANAITYSQRPGHSEHQLGLAIDFKAAAEATSLTYPD